jgi:hypothetical protein
VKLFAIGLLVLGTAAVTIPAFADPPAATPAPATTAPATTAPATTAAPKPVPTQTATEMTIPGRLDKPTVLVEVKRPTAASAARDAHAQMRIEWMKKLEPSTTRAVR